MLTKEHHPTHGPKGALCPIWDWDLPAESSLVNPNPGEKKIKLRCIRLPEKLVGKSLTLVDQEPTLSELDTAGEA